MLKDLQRELIKLNNQLSGARDHDAPAEDIEELKVAISKVTYQIMKICRGEY